MLLRSSILLGVVLQVLIPSTATQGFRQRFSNPGMRQRYLNQGDRPRFINQGMRQQYKTLGLPRQANSDNPLCKYLDIGECQGTRRINQGVTQQYKNLNIFSKRTNTADNELCGYFTNADCRGTTPKSINIRKLCSSKCGGVLSSLSNEGDAVTVGDQSFIVRKDPKTWVEARDICVSGYGADLAHPKDIAGLANVLAKRYASNDIFLTPWLGASDAHITKEWRWNNGQILDISTTAGWQTNKEGTRIQPNGEQPDYDKLIGQILSTTIKPDQDCLYIIPDSGDGVGGLGDSSCSIRREFICGSN